MGKMEAHSVPKRSDEREKDLLNEVFEELNYADSLANDVEHRVDHLLERLTSVIDELNEKNSTDNNT